MGLLSDTLEDNREFAGKIELAEFAFIELPPTPPSGVCCPVCDRIFGSDLALNNHIAQEHGREHVYIKANGRVVRGTEVFRQKVNQCELVLLGLGGVTVMIQAGKRRKQFLVEANTDLLEHIPTEYMGEVRVTVSHDRTKRDFLMYFNTEPPFDTRELNRLITAFQERLEQGIEPDGDAYQKRQRSLVQNDLEKHYLDGFFEYCLGFFLEKQGHWPESGMHLETAMHLLRPYATRPARTARRILAIRMNCFTPLQHCHRSSVFYPARVFFVDGDLILPLKTGDSATPPEGVRFANSPSDAIATRDERVYLDGFTELVLAAIKAFYARDFFILDGTLEMLERHPLATDTNNEGKLLLLKARGAHVRGDQRTARKNYERLLYHPIFGSEAQEFCNVR